MLNSQVAAPGSSSRQRRKQQLQQRYTSLGSLLDGGFERFSFSLTVPFVTIARTFFAELRTHQYHTFFFGWKVNCRSFSAFHSTVFAQFSTNDQWAIKSTKNKQFIFFSNGECAIDSCATAKSTPVIRFLGSCTGQIQSNKISEKIKSLSQTAKYNDTFRRQ